MILFPAFGGAGVFDKDKSNEAQELEGIFILQKEEIEDYFQNLVAKKKYDIECWMPSRDGYGETHSSSKFHDFQARRLKMRYRDSHGTVQFCHTLNNTLVATPRILISILECCQQKDHSVVIPEVLRQYMGGIEVIEPKK